MLKINTKKRINLSVSPDLNNSLEKLARRDSVPVATKTLELIKKAIEIEEDIIWDNLATSRDKRGTKYLSHKEAWL